MDPTTAAAIVSVIAAITALVAATVPAIRAVQGRNGHGGSTAKAFALPPVLDPFSGHHGGTMTRPAWLCARIHRWLDYDGAYGAQCVDIINDYLDRVLGLAPVTGNAVDISRQVIVGHTWTANTPTNFPPAWAIVVWGRNVKAGTGEAGHVALCLDAGGAHLLTLDQNWPEGAACQATAHTFDGVLGWHAPS